MAKLLLLSILLFLLVAADSSMAWPSYSDDAEQDTLLTKLETENRHTMANTYYNDAEQDTLSAELEKEDRHAVANMYYDDAEVATYSENADTADDDDNMAIAAHNQHTIAEINRRRRGRKGRRKGGHQRPKNKSG